MIKTPLIILFLTSSLVFANNEIYLEQEGTTGTFDITQVGSSNKIGDSTDISTIAGDNSDFDISQLGNGNTLDIEYDGDQTDFDLYIEGNSNSQDLFITGDQNTIDSVFVGSGNSLTISKDDTTDDPSLISQSQIKNFVTGGNNSIDLYLNDNIGAVSDITVIGSGNAIDSIQEGGNLGVGHSSTVQIQGDNNNLELVQSGSENQILELTHYGHDTTFTIIQSDGSGYSGLEGLGTISNFDGSYTQTFATPDFVQITNENP